MHAVIEPTSGQALTQLPVWCLFRRSSWRRCMRSRRRRRERSWRRYAARQLTASAPAPSPPSSCASCRTCEIAWLMLIRRGPAGLPALLPDQVCGFTAHTDPTLVYLANWLQLALLPHQCCGSRRCACLRVSRQVQFWCVQSVVSSWHVCQLRSVFLGRSACLFLERAQIRVPALFWMLSSTQGAPGTQGTSGMHCLLVQITGRVAG